MNCVKQAEKIYEICVVNAKQGKTTTYHQVLDYLGYGKKVPGHAIKFGLELVWIACAHMKLPMLTSIVVNVITGAPTASGYPSIDWKQDAQKVFNYEEWPNVERVDWNYIWDNRKRLSNLYKTRGYWDK